MSSSENLLPHRELSFEEQQDLIKQDEVRKQTHINLKHSLTTAIRESSNYKIKNIYGKAVLAHEKAIRILEKVITP